MPDVPGSISALPAASSATNTDRVPLDQQVGSVIAAGSLVVGLSYRIVTLGTGTNWVAAGAGASPAAGKIFVCSGSAGGGTGTAQQVITRYATLAQVLAGVPGGATNITYDPATRLVDSSTGDGATLPLAGDVIGGAAVAGLLPAAGAARLAQLDATDSPTFAGLVVTGTATAAQFDGDLTGAVSAHCRNVSGVSLAALAPLHVVGSQGDTSILEVVAARADSPSLMPASGLALAALGTNGSAANGHLVVGGVIPHVNTAGLTSGQVLFVAPAGGLTSTRPPANVQSIAIVGRVHATTGTVIVLPGSVLSLAAHTGAYSDLSGRPDLSVYSTRKTYRSAFAFPYLYLGSAASGTAENATSWTVRRIQQTTAGAVTATLSATGAWVDYSSLSYS